MLVVISGASQGLGKSIAAEYLKRGNQVVLVSRTQSKLDAAAKELFSVYPQGTVSVVPADVSDPEQCQDVFAQVGQTPDLVICCAGEATTGFFVEHTPQTLAKNLSTVYNTALYFSHAAMRVFANDPTKATVKRRIVFVSSVVAVFPLIGYSAYAPAKAAIRSLSDILAQEGLEHNVNVQHIMPGSMATPGFDHENLTKPSITTQIEGASAALPPDKVAEQVVRDLERGERTIFTDTIGWVLGSTMMGTSPRAGWGILESIVGVLLAIFGRVVAWSINNDIKKYFSANSR